MCIAIVAVVIDKPIITLVRYRKTLHWPLAVVFIISHADSCDKSDYIHKFTKLCIKAKNICVCTTIASTLLTNCI